MSNYDFTEQYPYYEPTSENTPQMSENRIQGQSVGQSFFLLIMVEKEKLLKYFFIKDSQHFN